MKSITMVLLAIAAITGIDAANADEVRAMEVVVVTAQRVEQLPIELIVATVVPAPAIDFTELTIQAPKLHPAATGETPKRIELAIGNREVSKS